MRRYEEKVAHLCETLNDPLVRDDAAAALRSLVESVTAHVDDEGRVSLEVEASTSMLIDFAWTCPGKVESSLEVKGELDDEAATVHEGI